MEISDVYTLAYSGRKVFDGSEKIFGDFMTAQILSQCMEELLEQPDEISYIDVYIYVMKKIGITLDDIIYYHHHFVRSEDIDSLLYINYSKDKLFKDINAMVGYKDAFLKKIADIGNPKNVQSIKYSNNRTFIFYQSNFGFCTDILTKNKQNKNFAKSGKAKLLEEFVYSYKILDELQTNYTKQTRKWAEKFDLTPKKRIELLRDFIEASGSFKVDEAKDIFLKKAKEKNSVGIRPQEDDEEDEDEDFEINLRHLEKIHERVVGQTEALETIKNRIYASTVGFRKENKPIATFLLTGPTGVGKTETAKAIADLCFDGRIHIEDMSSYKDDIAISRLTGGSPNYVGYNETTSFCKFLQDNDSGVLLFDELDKANASCLDIMLRILDEGEFVDAKGNEYSLEDMVIFATTNLSENLEKDGQNIEERLTSDAWNSFRKEFVGRFDAVIEYKELTKRERKKILKNMIDTSIKNFHENNTLNIRLSYDSLFVDYIYEDADGKTFGARSLRHSVEKKFENQTAQYIYKNKIKDARLKLSAKDSEIVFNTEKLETSKSKPDDGISL